MRITRGTTTNMKKMKVGIKLPDKWYRLDTDKKKKMATRKDENEANDIFTLDNRISVDCFFCPSKVKKTWAVILLYNTRWNGGFCTRRSLQGLLHIKQPSQLLSHSKEFQPPVSL
jgi:hypothetical protein